VWCRAVPVFSGAARARIGQELWSALLGCCSLKRCNVSGPDSLIADRPITVRSPWVFRTRGSQGRRSRGVGPHSGICRRRQGAAGFRRLQP
jgi:hypothetical protein